MSHPPFPSKPQVGETKSPCAGILRSLVLLPLFLAACQKPLPHVEKKTTPFPWIKYEAENATTTGILKGPSRDYLTPESESSGRRHVRLESQGQYVEFKLGAAANALVMRYSLPDAAKGDGLESTLSLYVNGRFVKKLPLTSRHAWIYGDFPWSNDPAKGRAHHFFDEMNCLLEPMPAGSTVRLQRDADDAAAYYLIDFAEFEEVAPPLPQPADSLSIVDFGGTPDDAKDDSTALSKCMKAASEAGKSVWIPKGVFRLDGERIALRQVKIFGAGMWHSRLVGTRPMFVGSGATATVSDLGIFGDTNERKDDEPDNAFHGNLGTGSVFKNLWIEHLKCGFWTTQGTINARLEGCRIRNVMADGLNFCNGTSRSTVQHCHLRNTGDDALATWSPREGKDWIPGKENKFLDNIVETPWHANGIAIYGGGDHLVAGNKISGTVQSGGGVLVSSGFNCVPYCGPIHVRDNLIEDTGGDCYIGQQVGGVWIHAHNSDIEVPIILQNLEIDNSSKAAISIHGPMAAKNIQIRNVKIKGRDRDAVHIFSNASGRLTLEKIAIEESQYGLVMNDNPQHFQVVTETTAP